MCKYLVLVLNTQTVIQAITTLILWVWVRVTRFGEISPLLEIFWNLSQYFKVHFIFGQVLNPFWNNFYTFRQVFIIVNGQILKINPAIWSHWTLDVKFLSRHTADKISYAAFIFFRKVEQLARHRTEHRQGHCKGQGRRLWRPQTGRSLVQPDPLLRSRGCQ